MAVDVALDLEQRIDALTAAIAIGAFSNLASSKNLRRLRVLYRVPAPAQEVNRMFDYRLSPSGTGTWSENSSRHCPEYRSARQRRAQDEIDELVHERALVQLAIEARKARQAVAGVTPSALVALAEKVNSRRLR